MMNMRYYILVGDIRTWESAFSKNFWGFAEKSKGSWKTTDIGDFVLFYVTSPVMKIIGLGKIVEKFIDEDIFWPDEKIFKKSLWKYRLKFEPIYVVNDWKEGIERPKNIMLNQGRKVIDKDLFFDLVKKAELKWKHKIQQNLNLF